MSTPKVRVHPQGRRPRFSRYTESPGSRRLWTGPRSRGLRPSMRGLPRTGRIRDCDVFTRPRPQSPGASNKPGRRLRASPRARPPAKGRTVLHAGRNWRDCGDRDASYDEEPSIVEGSTEGCSQYESEPTTSPPAAVQRAWRIRPGARIDGRAVGPRPGVGGDGLEEADRAVGEEHVAAAGVEARRVVQGAVAVGVRVEHVPVQQDQAGRQVSRRRPSPGRG